MPVIVSDNDLELLNRLKKAGAIVMSETQALTQDIRPARIGILNLMPAPAMESTENQWLRYMSNTVLQIEPILLKFDDDIRERDGASRQEILKRYVPWSKGISDGLDGLIVTGDNLERRKEGTPYAGEELPFEEITYGDSLREVISWARENIFSTIYSCLGSHFALNYLYGVKRTISEKKIFGVYTHEINKYSRGHILKGLDDILNAPHSRWGSIAIEDLKNVGVNILALNEEVGWLIAVDENNAGGYDVHFQGHPEYDKYDLHSEFIRDWENGQAMPKDYYDENNPASLPKMTWANDARAVHSNWMSSIYDHFSKEH